MRSRILGSLAGVALSLSLPAGAVAAVPPPQPPPLGVTAASLILAGSGRLLWSENGQAEHAIASTTKLMTVRVVLQHVSDLNAVFTQGGWLDQVGDSQIGLVPGEQMSVRNLLLATLIPSADDAAWDLAYNVGGGSIPRFLAMMNAQAVALGLHHTHYATPSGLDTPGNYSSADDLAHLANLDMLQFPFMRSTVDQRSATIEVGSHYETVTNTNTLLGAVPWILGIKTGFTADAGYVLVAEGRRDGFTLIDAVLGTHSEQQRNAAALALLDYGFQEYHLVKPLHRGQVLGRVPVANSARTAAVVAVRNVQWVAPRGVRVRVLTRVRRTLRPPLPAGALVGRARVFVGRHMIAIVAVALRRRLVASPPTPTGARASAQLAGAAPRGPRSAGGSGGSARASGLLSHDLAHTAIGPFTLVLVALAIGAVSTLATRRLPRRLTADQMEEHDPHRHTKPSAGPYARGAKLHPGAAPQDG